MSSDIKSVDAYTENMTYHAYAQSPVTLSTSDSALSLVPSHGPLTGHERRDTDRGEGTADAQKAMRLRGYETQIRNHSNIQTCKRHHPKCM